MKKNNGRKGETMGMYTELNIGVELKRDTPQEVIDVIDYMAGNKETIENIPNHPLFDTSRWAYLLRASSYYFDAQPINHFKRDDITGTYFLTSVSNLKNYHSEIELFLDWISKYIDTDGFIGYKRYEESRYPTLIINQETSIIFRNMGGFEDKNDILDIVKSNIHEYSSNMDKWVKWEKFYESKNSGKVNS